MRLPESWVQVRLSDIITDIQPGFAQRPGDEATGTSPQIRTHNVTPSGTITLHRIKHVTASPVEIERYSLTQGDIVFNNTNSEEWVGKTAVFDEAGDFVFSNHMTRIRVDERLVDPTFLARYLHFLWSIGFSRTRAKRWVSQAGIEAGVLAAFKIPLPTLYEQERIVDVFRQKEELAVLFDKAKRRFSKLGKARFYELFGHPAENPKGFDTQFLRHFGGLDRGVSKHRPRDAPQLFDGPYPFIQTGDVSNADDWITTYSRTYSEVGLSQSRLWPKGTLCITIAANIGRAAILDFDACFPDSVVGFTPNEDVTSEYVLYCLRFYQEYFEARAPKSAQMNINLETLRKLRVPKPPHPLQREFSEFIAELRKMSGQIEEQSEKRDELSQDLQALAFSGDLTQDWRADHAIEISDAQERRDALLAETSNRRATSDVTVGSARSALVFGDRPTRQWLHGQLSEFQRRVLHCFSAYTAEANMPLLTEDPDAFTAFCDDDRLTQALAGFEQVSPNRIGRTRANSQSWA